MNKGQGMSRSLTQYSKINISDLDKYLQSVKVFYNYKNNHYNNMRLRNALAR